MSETRFRYKSPRISSFHNVSSWSFFRFCTEHGSITAVLCTKFKNDFTTAKYVVNKREFAKFEFKMSFGRIHYTAIICWVWHTSLHIKFNVLEQMWKRRTIVGHFTTDFKRIFENHISFCVIQYLTKRSLQILSRHVQNFVAFMSAQLSFRQSDLHSKQNWISS